jgi:hypothetical protein
MDISEKSYRTNSGGFSFYNLLSLVIKQAPFASITFEAMKFFFRITILLLWMIGIAVSSYAGMKKCNRFSTKAKSTYTINVSEKHSPASGSAAKTNTATSGICAHAFALEPQQQEEPLVVPLLEETKFALLATLHVQEYISQPFSPPRLL